MPYQYPTSNALESACQSIASEMISSLSSLHQAIIQENPTQVNQHYNSFINEYNEFYALYKTEDPMFFLEMQIGGVHILNYFEDLKLQATNAKNSFTMSQSQLGQGASE